MKIHHVGIVCQDISEALKEFELFHPIIKKSEVIHDPLQNAFLCMVTSNTGLEYEFISGEQVQRLSKKGISYYHLCYEVANLEESINTAVENGAIMISEPKPAILFQNKRVAFLHFSYGLVELLEE